MPEITSDLVVLTTDVEGIGIVATTMRPQRCETLSRLVLLTSGRVPLKLLLDSLPHQSPFSEEETVELVHKFDVIMQRDLNVKPRAYALRFRVESTH